MCYECLNVSECSLVVLLRNADMLVFYIFFLNVHPFAFAE